MIDQTDKAIIGIMMKNSRTALLEIAKQLKVSESTIRQRVRSLEKEGVLKQYTAVIDPAAIGFSAVAYVGVDSVAEKFLEVGNKLSTMENVKFAARCSGDHMFMLEIWAKDGNELRTIIKEKIETIDGVTRTCPAIVSERLTA